VHKNALASWLTEPNLQDGKRVYLERAVAWPKVALDDAPKAMEALSLGELRQHLEALIAPACRTRSPRSHITRYDLSVIKSQVPI
jgi:hypothetical protein